MTFRLKTSRLLVGNNFSNYSRVILWIQFVDEIDGGDNDFHNNCNGGVSQALSHLASQLSNIIS